MRRTTAARLGAAFTASAIALSLGASTAIAEGDTTGTQTASAGVIASDANTGTAVDGPADARQPTGKTAVRPLAAGTGNITAFGQKSIVLSQPGVRLYEANPTFSDAGGLDYLTTRLTVDNSNKGTRIFDFGGLVLDSLNSPYGKAKLGPSTLFYSNGASPNSDPTIGNYFYIRRATTSISPKALDIVRTGSKIKFTANSWKIFKPQTETYVGMPRITLQYRNSNGSYSTLKTMSLNVWGTGSYTITTNTKRRYRLLIPTTNSISASITTTTGLI